jgi:small-conductance mechanosensitive channel
MGVRRAGAKIDHRRLMIVMVMLMVIMGMIMMGMTVAVMMIMMMPIMISAVMVMAMHGAIGMGMLVKAAIGGAFNRGLARGASANRTHQSTSSSLILSSSPEVTCN